MIQYEKVYLTPNPYSRPQLKMGKIKGVVIHWVGNPGSQAMANRNYFESLKVGQCNAKGEKIYGSSHYIIGLQGEVLACVPETEVAYHAGGANSQYLGIEVCHPDGTGKFSPVTYERLITCVAEICQRYHLVSDQAVKRHYDVTGKRCPLYYVQENQAWEQLKKDVGQVLNQEGMQTLEMLVNGQSKQVQGIKVEGHYYIKLRDLADKWLAVGYEPDPPRPTLEVRERW